MLKKLGGLFGPKSDQRSAVNAFLASCVAQRAVCRIDCVEKQKEKGKKYLFPMDMTGEGLVLESRTPYFSSEWLGKDVSFLMIVKGGPARQSQLHRFVSEVISVEGSFRIIVAPPLTIEGAERRQSVRIGLASRHMPNLAVWFISAGGEEGGVPKADPTPLVNLRSDASEMPDVLLDISSRGLRLGLSREQYELRSEAIKTGARVIVQMVFSSQAYAHTYKFLIVSRIRSIIFGVDGKERVGLGIQFMALRQPDADPAWKHVNTSGVDRLGRLVNRLQLEYYREIKRRMERLSVQD